MRYRVYLKLFNSPSTYEDDYVEVTRDVISVGLIGQQLDNTDYSIGVFRNSNFTILMRNDTGKYSNVGNLQSIFRYKRTNVQVKITRDERNYDLICGFFKAGNNEELTEEITIFEGLLSDVASASTISDQSIQFQVLGYESLFDNILVPFDSLSNSDLFSELIYKCVNQSPFSDIVTVDPDNISVGTDLIPDDISGFETETVTDALQDLLQVSRSILYIKDGVVYVSDRSPGVDLDYTFYGYGSIVGVENIVDIQNYKDGLNKTFNYWTYDGTTQTVQDDSSVENYGVIQNTISSELIATDNTVNIEIVLEDNLAEFAFPKIEFDLLTPCRGDALKLGLLDLVNVDYPNIYTPSDDNPLPRYGVTKYSDGKVYPIGKFSMTIPSSYRFKIMAKKVDSSKDLITFSLRRV